MYQTNHEKLIEGLRKEAQDMKDCFTRYSFQTFSITTVALGLLARFQKDEPLLGLSGGAIVLLCLSVGRIGIYKYTGSNRHYGFELFLDRLSRMTGNNSRFSIDELKTVSWEEAMRAWRIVQPTIFQELYEVVAEGKIKVFGKANYLKTTYRNGEQWFNVESLVTEGSKHYAGSYLRTMLSVLYIIVFLGVAAFAVMSVQFLSDRAIVGLLLLALTIFLVLVTLSRINQLNARRRMVENEFLSIHSCAIMWHVTITAHLETLRRLSPIEGIEVDSFRSYTQNLSQVANEIASCIRSGRSIYDWIEPNSEDAGRR